jgi:L-iditol 2-dehydrogenase
MHALVFSAPGQAKVAEVDYPRPSPGEVVVRSRVVGVCHSDLELLAGQYIIPIRYPIIPGHEWAGEIAEVGPGVEDFSPGDPVVGECVVGPRGRDHFGFSISGAIAEYFAVRAEWLHRLPAQLTFTQGALVEPFSVAYAAAQAGGIDPSDQVAVLGGGPIGLLSAMAAVGRGAAVTLIEPRPDRREKGLELVASRTIDPAAGDLREQALELTGGQLFDVVIESAGHPEAMAQALRIAGNQARVIYVGIDVGSHVQAELCLIQAKSLRIQGIVGSAGIWPQAIRFLASGVVDPSRLVTDRYPLDAAVDALEAAALGAGNIKVHIEAPT